MARSSSASNASQNVSRGGSRGNAGALAPRPSGTVSGGYRGARAASKGSSAASEAQMGLSRFLPQGENGFELGPQQVLIFSLGFIFTVVVLHIIGKLRG